MPEIRLSIPARAEYVHVLRSVTAGVAAMLSFTYDDIEDLRLAVDEACAYLLGGTGERTLEMTIRSERDALEIVASVDGTPAPRADNKATVMWHILGALTDEARFEDADGRPSIRLTKRCPA